MSMPLEVYRFDGKLPSDKNFSYGLETLRRGEIYLFINLGAKPAHPRYFLIPNLRPQTSLEMDYVWQFGMHLLDVQCALQIKMDS